MAAYSFYPMTIPYLEQFWLPLALFASLRVCIAYCNKPNRTPTVASWVNCHLSCWHSCRCNCHEDSSVCSCVYYCALNKIVRKDVYPVSRMDDALDSLHGAEYISSLDFRPGYWQIPTSKSDKAKTTFATLMALRVQCDAFWTLQCACHIRTHDR